MKKVLLIGEKYSQNLGDGVICSVVEGLLHDNFDFEIIDLSGRTSYIKNTNSFNIKNEKIVYFKSIIKKILSKFGYHKMGNNLSVIYDAFIELFDNKTATYVPDAILIAGGQMFIDSFVNQLDYIKKYCEKTNIPLIFNSCGGGNILDKNTLQNVLNSKCVKYISVRDNFEIIKDYTSNDVYDTFDTAVLTNKVFEINNEIDKSILGVGIMFSTLQPVSKQIRFWKKTIKKLTDKKIDFKIFTNGSIKDFTFAKFILDELDLSNDYLLDRPNNPEELIREICTFDSILSMRLHSLIIAYSYNIPTIAISWDNKVDAFFKKINRSKFCYNFEVNPEEIIKKINISKNEKYDENIKKNIIESIEKNLNDISDIIK